MQELAAFVFEESADGNHIHRKMLCNRMILRPSAMEVMRRFLLVLVLKRIVHDMALVRGLGAYWSVLRRLYKNSDHPNAFLI